MRKLTDYKVMPIFPMAPVSDPRVSPDGGGKCALHLHYCKHEG